MELNSSNLSHENTDSAYDRNAEVKAFDESKVGVRGLVECGVTKIPRMFYSGELNIFDNSNNNSALNVPIIDLKGIHVDPARRIEVISQIRTACKEWGFFQVINHEIPICVLDEMLDGFRRFHEQDSEMRRQFYNRDTKKNIVYFSNTSLYQNKFVNWRDSFGCSMAPNPPKSEEFPEVFR